MALTATLPAALYEAGLVEVSARMQACIPGKAPCLPRSTLTGCSVLSRYIGSGLLGLGLGGSGLHIYHRHSKAAGSYRIAGGLAKTP